MIADPPLLVGAVNAIAGSFTVALAAAITVFWMTRLKIPVSTSQAIVGAIDRAPKSQSIRR